MVYNKGRKVPDLQGGSVPQRIHKKPSVVPATGGFALSFCAELKCSQQQSDDGKHNGKHFKIAHVHHLPALVLPGSSIHHVDLPAWTYYTTNIAQM